MSAMAAIDIDLQDLIATVYTVATEHDIFNPDNEEGLDGRAILLSRLLDLGWLSPTERDAARNSFAKGDGQRLLNLLGGPSLPSCAPVRTYGDR